MNALLRRALKRLVPWPGVREDLRAAEISLRRVATGIRRQLFRRTPPAGDARERVRLNVGCGDLIVPGWCNLDENPGEGAHYVDVRNGLPFPDASVVHIHCEHFLEHLDFFNANRLLVEFHRVLETGGTLRLIVPDAERYCRAYAQGDRAYFERLEDLGGTPVPFDTPMQIINQMFRMAGAHKFAWDFDTLTGAMHDAGFGDVVRSSPHDVRPDDDIDGTDWWREVESLYVNASKRLNVDAPDG